MRLKASQVAEHREHLLAEQGGLCPLCALPVNDAVLDHAHGASRGWTRGTLCRSHNLFLGKFEQYKRYRVEDVVGFLRNAANYLEKHETNQTGVLHPSHKTPDEKKAAAKKRRARKAK